MKRTIGIALVGALAAFGAGCGDDETPGTGGTGGNGGTGGDTGPCVIEIGVDSDEINEDQTWDRTDCDYVLTRIVYVVDSTLTIAAGVTVKGDEGSALIISRGSTIDAQGTKENPIVMTSSRAVGSRTRGDWGGLAVLGNGIINRGIGTCTAPDCEKSIEGLPISELRGRYGGTDNESSCGTIKYMRIEFAGREVIPGNELNGLTVGACGSGTTLDYIQVHRGLDDGVELFGGAVNISHVITDGMGDDGLDWDEGYVGTIQNFIVHHYDGRTDDPRGIEADNFGDETNQTPRSAPTVQYGTVVADDGADHLQGIQLRRGTWGILDGIVVQGYNNEGGGINIADDGWDAATGGWPDELVVRNTCTFENSPNWPVDADCGGAGETDCDDESTENAGTYFEENVAFAVGALNNLQDNPQLGDFSSASTGGVPAPDYSVSNGNCMNAFSTTGADDGTDWTEDWTAFPVN